MYWLGEKKIPFSIIFTKADKIKSNNVRVHVDQYFNIMNNQWSFLPNHFITSALKKNGLVEILNYIGKINCEL